MSGKEETTIGESHIKQGAVPFVICCIGCGGASHHDTPAAACPLPPICASCQQVPQVRDYWRRLLAFRGGR